MVKSWYLSSLISLNFRTNSNLSWYQVGTRETISPLYFLFISYNFHTFRQMLIYQTVNFASFFVCFDLSRIHMWNFLMIGLIIVQVEVDFLMSLFEREIKSQMQEFVRYLLCSCSLSKLLPILIQYIIAWGSFR